MCPRQSPSMTGAPIAARLAMLALSALATPALARCRRDAAELVHQPVGDASAQNPAYNPDGQKILFTRFVKGYNLGDAGLFVLPLAGGPESALLDEVGHAAVNLPGTSWNAATDRITFSSDRIATDEVWTIAPDGSPGSRFQVTIQTPPYKHYQEPSFNPDGEWIVFEAVADAPELAQRGTLWKIRAADRTGLTKLIDGPMTNTDNRQPNWSPLGDRILFQRRVGDTESVNLYTVATDGSDVQPLTTGGADTDASWSPDGLWIVYSSDAGGLPVPSLFVVAATGGTPVRITDGGVYGDGAASWSPDGKWIAFESHVAADEKSPASLWRIRVPWPFGSACSPNGAPCDDANPCTTADQCQAAVCTGTANTGASCDDDDPCTQADTCQAGSCLGVPTPFPSCHQPFASAKATVDIRDREPDALDVLDRFTWVWRNGSATDASEFGSPTASTRYDLCVFDYATGTPTVAMSESIPAGEHWTATSTGFRYRDPDGRNAAISSALLKAGLDRKAQITVKSGGACSGVPSLPLLQSPSVLVQLGNGSACWEAVYSSNTSNSADHFKAKAD